MKGPQFICYTPGLSYKSFITNSVPTTQKQNTQRSLPNTTNHKPLLLYHNTPGLQILQQPLFVPARQQYRRIRVGINAPPRLMPQRIPSKGGVIIPWHLMWITVQKSHRRSDSHLTSDTERDVKSKPVQTSNRSPASVHDLDNRTLDA